MKRYIRDSKYLPGDSNVLFDDKLLIDVEIDFRTLIAAATNSSIVKFPGIDKFKVDVLKILENKYNFEVIEDVYEGKLQKGYISNREGSCSVYFDTYYNVKNAVEPMKRLGVNRPVPEADNIYCFIHIRFSDHQLNDDTDINHIRYLDQNAKKYTHDRDDVIYTEKEADINVPEQKLYYYYDEALELLQDRLDEKIVSWVRQVERELKFRETHHIK